MPRLTNQWRVRGAAASIGVLLAAAGGCGKDPVKPPPPTAFQYLAPNSPRNVLQNLITAYTRRDSVETAAVYDSTYVGTSIDPSASTPIPDFTRRDEIHHVSVLKVNVNIVSVYLDLGSPASWQRLPANASDPSDWAVIQISSSVIRIEDISTATTHESTNQTMEYTFRPTEPAPGDTTWTVVRWTEIAN